MPRIFAQAVASILATLVCLSPASAAEPTIPTKPSAPAPFAPPKRVEAFRCERYFIYRGKELRCDSIVRQDGEQLRSILQPVPQAIAELNIYQKNRRDLRRAAYIGTAGLVLATVAYFVAQKYRDSAATLERLGDLSGTQARTDKADLFKALTWSGVAVTGGTILYGVSLLRTNELHLGNAVQLYNDAHPDDAIQLQFTTGISF